uniref:RAP domain-containing protein n=1 Tax=Babesia bovis TaxID=5865 RepID=A7ATD8_BABBO|eukprot:XP_001609767.1 hypothetical protein [Babesia bovis T2Bo]
MLLRRGRLGHNLRIVFHRPVFLGRRNVLTLDRPIPDDIEETRETSVQASKLPGSGSLVVNFDIAKQLSLCSRVDDVCTLFLESRLRWNPKQLLLFLSRIVALTCRANSRHDAVSQDLWPCTDFCQCSLYGWGGSSHIMRLPAAVASMYTDILSKVDALGITELLYALRLGEYIRGYHNRVLESHCERILSGCLWHLDLLDLCRAVCVLCQSTNVEFAKLLCHVSLTRFVEFSPTQRLFVFRALANAKHASSLFLRGCIRHVLNEDLFCDQGVLTVLAQYGQHPSSCSAAVFQSLLKRALSLDFGTISPLELCDLLWVTVKFSNVAPEAFSRAEPCLLPICSELPPKHVSMLLWSLAQSKYVSHALIDALESAAMATCSNMTPSQLSIALHSLSSLKPLDTRFADHIEREVIDAIQHFNGLDLAMLAEGYARVNTGSPTLHQCIQESALRYSDELPADCLAKLLWSYGHLLGKESLYLGLQIPLLSRVNQFPAHELSRVLWAYAVHRFYDVSFWANCLSMIDIDHVRGNSRCVHLYPALSEVVQGRSLDVRL